MQLAVGAAVSPGKFTGPTVKVNVSRVTPPLLSPLKKPTTPRSEDSRSPADITARSQRVPPRRSSRSGS